ncbi:hypothetical protein EV193_101855 [Herbihabitans rhizosphaerae]|uniref:WD40 repeat protein n=1 Tax=Herbihabitans rhizosphaerae TaxID=1872711 RepID=A0A4Q7L6N1_9PSEU|nr:hypothetical protein [Herbihabitans rhizosphaerae]RZS44974.1 hypothetical protein EV193_101855 [Herbihabitans rhizosphaerae]
MALRVVDVDEQVRVLALADDRLVEIDSGTGSRKTLSYLPDLRAARYLPGERSVILQHGSPARLSLLHPDQRRASPLVREPERVCELLDVLPGRVMYRTNRRDQGAFDVVIRNAHAEAEQAVYEHGGEVLEAAVSPDSRLVVVRLTDELVLVDTMPATAGGGVRSLGRRGEPVPTGVRWLPGSKTMIGTLAGADQLEVVRRTPTERSWRTVTTVPSPHGVAHGVALPAPDARITAVITPSRISLHRNDNGDTVRELTVPGTVLPNGVAWAPGTAVLAVSVDDSDEITLIDTNTGSTRLI